MRMRKVCKDFLSSNGGNVALTTGLCAIPLMLIAGAALDYMRASQSAATLQAAVDSAALAGGASPNTDEAMVKQLVRDYLARNGAEEITGSIDEIKIERPDEKTFKVTTGGRISTTLMQIAGIKDMDIGAVSEVMRDYGQLEVALVLDNTASMRGSKLQALKDSAHLLAGEVFSGSEHKGVKVALIPFSQYVNVGMSRRDAPWMAVPGDYSESKEDCDWVPKDPKSCRWETCRGTDDGLPVSWSCQKCDGGWVKQNCKTQTVEHKWHGCVGSRDYPLNVKDMLPETPYPGLLDVSCASEIMPLTADKNRIGDEIENMTATGETYIPAGLIWGWNAVSSAQPLSEGTAESEPGTTKAIVLMTDGENTLSPTYPAHDGRDDELSDKLSLELCTNIKMKEIKVFTVSFEVTDPVTENMLKSCASSPGDYHNADNPAQLKTAFKDIAGALAQLRISR
jgi:Flp pilus assembly protein TadG